jgi:hypothetical protein
MDTLALGDAAVEGPAERIDLVQAECVDELRGAVGESLDGVTGCPLG